MSFLSNAQGILNFGFVITYAICKLKFACEKMKDSEILLVFLNLHAEQDFGSVYALIGQLRLTRHEVRRHRKKPVRCSEAF
ncbi:MAG: hypothetical protein ACRYGR_07440 [Janthinobacterium lividum]